MSHKDCSRGELPINMVFCETVSNTLKDSTMTYVTFEQRDVETFGKGKPFSRMEKVETQVSYESFLSKFRFVVIFDLFYKHSINILGMNFIALLSILLHPGF